MHLKAILILSFFLSVTSLSGYAQCASSFTVDQNFSETENEGTLTIQVQANGSFECNLLLLKDGFYEKLEDSNGQNNAKVVFSSLGKNAIYKVEVIFKDEQGLCRIRQKGGIKF